jgi:membrane-anchored glycerophosphoryl diester phosphodiesterase (GDPDase)
MKLLLKKFLEKLAMAYLILVLVWVFVALSFDVYMLYLDFSGQDEKLRTITNELWRRLDYNYR